MSDPSREELLRTALARTESLLHGVRSSEIPVAAVPDLLQHRLAEIVNSPSIAPLSDVERDLALRIGELDDQLLAWCEQSMRDVRDQLTKVRRAGPTPTSPARLVSESA